MIGLEIWFLAWRQERKRKKAERAEANRPFWEPPARVTARLIEVGPGEHYSDSAVQGLVGRRADNYPDWVVERAWVEDGYVQVEFGRQPRG